MLLSTFLYLLFFAIVVGLIGLGIGLVGSFVVAVIQGIVAYEKEKRRRR